MTPWSASRPTRLARRVHARWPWRAPTGVARRGRWPLAPTCGSAVSPCAERGTAAAYLAVAAPASRAEIAFERTTRRQAELLEHLALGLTNAEIATAMGVAETTVKTWLRRLYRRAGVNNRVALLRWVHTEQGT